MRYGKPVLSFLIAVGYLAYQKFTGDGRIDGIELALIITAFGNAAITYIVPLVPEYKWAKTGGSAIVSLGLGLSAVALSGYTNDELVTVGLSVLQFLGVAIAPAVSDNGVAAKAGIGD
jgi:uncharacterized membrane protein YccC